MVKEPAQMPWVFREAFRIAQDGLPGAVLIDLLVDVQRGMIEYDVTFMAPSLYMVLASCQTPSSYAWGRSWPKS